ncbi:Holliday junction branch migration protein RuvA [Microbacterium stercoris]|uniref:Holliday junction branch migration complex subunit RuvA n=1 Tax=Microbacterium stercoris TaxID=2820289 RepID=A0A939QLA1_9MICO|nr:Holliday junction branch migration protein RuvA [Microbacterium stercoris]MBO3664280.1 Holliday junction branch migration protein RuvA [Microbacterium stercoris]MBO3664541.1 Holliday junction branch migration protein RuvA [Microbacterium stercoris]
MISSLRGTVLHAAADSVVVEVGGVGFSVAVPPDVARTARPGETLALHTNLIVREDALSLFGFLEREELEVFIVLLGVSGVGPKSALGVLSGLTVDQIAAAVAEEDDAPFRKVSGIGPKTAKLIVLQLQGKLAPPAPAVATKAAPDVAASVVQAVAGLGWPERVAGEAVAQAAEAASDADRASVQALLRLTLALLGPAKQAARG